MKLFTINGVCTKAFGKLKWLRSRTQLAKLCLLNWPKGFGWVQVHVRVTLKTTPLSVKYMLTTANNEVHKVNQRIHHEHCIKTRYYKTKQ